MTFFLFAENAASKCVTEYLLAYLSQRLEWTYLIKICPSRCCTVLISYLPVQNHMASFSQNWHGVSWIKGRFLNLLQGKIIKNGKKWKWVGIFKDLNNHSTKKDETRILNFPIEWGFKFVQSMTSGEGWGHRW